MNLIELEAKKIMDDFINALEDIDEAQLDIGQHREAQLREKDEGVSRQQEDFKELWFKLLPNGEQNGFVVSEKKKW